MNNITTIVLDCDGVLTPAHQNIDVNGSKQFKTFNCRDISALRRLSDYYRIVICTADEWLGTRAWAEKVGVEYIYTKTKHKIDVDWNSTLMCADDYFLDKEALLQSEYPCTPLDGSILFDEYDHLEVHRLETKGGDGIVEELILEYKLKI
jgi:3-deoxy-D-manno-octulosonate 8-phosphate phosphatase KdsC-like HAD superfamily phosphatase